MEFSFAILKSLKFGVKNKPNQTIGIREYLEFQRDLINQIIKLEFERFNFKNSLLKYSHSYTSYIFIFNLLLKEKKTKSIKKIERRKNR